MRIGLFGGTFNPIHCGHLRAALEVREGFPLDACYLIPSAVPPHKRDQVVTDADDRMEMIRRAIDGTPGFTLCDAEIQRSGPSYTVDTVAELKRRLPEETELFLMLGLDAFLEIDTWKNYRRLLQGLPLIVMIRPQPGIGGITDPVRRVEEYLHNHISAGYRESRSPTCFTHHRFPTIFTFAVTLMDISSSSIRERIRRGQSIRYLVPQSVQAYIRGKGLYT
jgi:nicotinate-nucleotide adenylyltransferase